MHCAGGSFHWAKGQGEKTTHLALRDAMQAALLGWPFNTKFGTGRALESGMGMCALVVRGMCWDVAPVPELPNSSGSQVLLKTSSTSVS